MIHTLALFSLNVVYAAESTQVDFDDVEVTANLVKPNYQLLMEATRNVCPEPDSVEDAGWTECVVNLSYGDIKQVCQSLGDHTPRFVDQLINRAERYDGFDNDVSTDRIDWKGCFYNSKNGSEVGSYRFKGTGGGWIVMDPPDEYRRVTAGNQSTLTVFDGYRSDGVRPASGTMVKLPATFAYKLDRHQPGYWLAEPSTTNQDNINRYMESENLFPPYCGSERIHATRDDSPLRCSILPNLVVVAVSPTMLVVRSLNPLMVGYQVHGVFWKSETGFDIAQGG